MVDLKNIRNILNMLRIFNQNKHYTWFKYDDVVGSDRTFEEFMKICGRCCFKDYGFLTTNLFLKPADGKYIGKLQILTC